jgi:YbbR domain-containing protein
MFKNPQISCQILCVLVATPLFLQMKAVNAEQDLKTTDKKKWRGPSKELSKCPCE